MKTKHSMQNKTHFKNILNFNWFRFEISMLLLLYILKSFHINSGDVHENGMSNL